MNTLLELYRHKSWATLRLIEYCQSLDPQHLHATMAGTYGTIPATLQHVVEAEEDYYSVLTGEHMSEPFPAGPVRLEELA